MFFQRMKLCCKQLIIAFEKDSQNIDIYVSEFVDAVNEAMNKYSQGKIGVEIKQLPKPMHMIAT